MKTKALLSCVTYKNTIWAVPFAMAVFAFICSTIKMDIQPDLRFINTWNSPPIVFLMHVPLILIFSVTVQAKLDNDLLRVRCRSHLAVYQLKLRAAFMMAGIYFVIKTAVEIVALWLVGGLWVLSGFFECLAIYGIQFGTILFAFALFLMLEELFNSRVGAILVFLLIFGIDLFSSMMPLYGGTFVEIGLFHVPMGLMIQYASCLGQASVNLLYYCSYLLVKIILVIWIPILSIRWKRRERFVQA